MTAASSPKPTTIESRPTDGSTLLNAILREAPDDIEKIMSGLSRLARQYGMSRLARETGLSRESLYKTLSGTRSPEFATVLKILKALNFDFVVRDKSVSTR